MAEVEPVRLALEIKTDHKLSWRLDDRGAGKAILNPGRVPSRLWTTYIDPDVEPVRPFAALVFYMRLFYGPLFWPIVIANAIGWTWCTYQGLRELDEGLLLLWRVLTATAD